MVREDKDEPHPCSGRARPGAVSTMVDVPARSSTHTLPQPSHLDHMTRAVPWFGHACRHEATGQRQRHQFTKPSGFGVIPDVGKEVIGYGHDESLRAHVS